VTPEVRWILACVGSLGGPHAPPAPDGTLSWDRVLTIAEAEGLAPALGFVVDARPPAAMPLAVRERLRQALADSTAGQLILGRELERLLEALDRVALPAIPLKGPALAETLYPKPVLRPSSDLDLLVRPETVLGVDGVLHRLGYRRLADDHSWDFDLAWDRATLYEGPARVRVDLHWSLLSEPLYAWDEAAGRAVWERAVTIPLAGRGALGLCPEDLLLYLAAHLAAHHGLAGLLWYWDLALLLGRWADRLDWDAIAARAARWRVRTALYFALLGCQRLFAIAAPARVLAELRPRGLRAAALRRLLRRYEADRLKRLEHLIALLLVDRTRDLIAPLTATLMPSPAWLRARYEGASASLLGHYLAHYGRMVTIAAAAIAPGPARRLPSPGCCSPPSSAAFPNRAGSPSPSVCGRPGGSRRKPSAKDSATPS
jgi:hypothetical protein